MSNNSSTANSMPWSGVELFFSYAFGFFFAFGETGNLVVWITLGCIFHYRQKSKALSHIFVYSIALTAADTLALIFLPLVITDILKRNWIFGKFLCRAYTVTEASSKLFSPFVLTLLSFDRYMAVCYPQLGYLRSQKFAIIAAATLLCMTLGLTAPLCYYTTVQYSIMANKVLCAQADMPIYLQSFTTYCLFVAGFCCPCLLMVTSYAALARKLLKHSRTAMISRRHGMTKVYVTSVLLVMFYVLCYGPYWFYNVVLTNFIDGGPGWAYAGYAIHILPYLNSSVNPIFYAFLNKELQRTRSEAMSNFSMAKSTTEGIGLRSRTNQHLDDCPELRDPLLLEQRKLRSMVLENRNTTERLVTGTSV